MNSKLIFKGIKWSGLEYGFSTVFRFVVKLLLAKLLVPEDFGLVGMTSIFIAIITAASELGLSAALIQKKNDSDAIRLYDTAFWSGIVWGIILYSLFCFVGGPIIAKFFDEPVLTKLIPILGVGILVMPLVSIHQVILTRSMDFKRIALIKNGATLIAGVSGIIMAFADYGVWALAANNFLAVFLPLPFYVMVTKWRPKFKWEASHFKSIIGFDNFMIGKMLGASLLGGYSLVFSLTEMLRQAVSSILNKVMYPVFGQHQNDPEKIKNYFLQIVKFNAIILYPIMIFFTLLGGPFLLDIFGEKWTFAIAPLRILAVSVIIHLIINSFASVIRGLGFPKLELKIIVISTLFILVPCLYFGIREYGIIGATFAVLINKLFLVLVAFYVLRSKIGVVALDFINALYAPILAILIGSLPVIFYFVYDNVEISWVYFGIAYFVFYGVAIWLLQKRYFISLIKKI